MEQINRERDDLQQLIVIDQSEFIQNSIDNVQQSAIWGGLLVVFILYLFLRNGSPPLSSPCRFLYRRGE